MGACALAEKKKGLRPFSRTSACLQMTSTLNAVPGGSFSYDANDRLATDSYDANGNTKSSAGIANTYDFENRMTAHGAVNIVYDGDGNRVSETAAGVTTTYLVDTLNPTHLPQVLDEIVNGAVTRTYAYGLQRIGENQQISGTWTPSFYGYDGHGNVRFLANAAASVTDSYDYDAFGMPIRTSTATANNYLYSGEWYDNSVGLYDLRARYYNQATGRFWVRDPAEGASCTPLTFNPYTYAVDDPTDLSDPTGLYTVDTALSYRLPELTIPGQIVLAIALACATEEDATGFFAYFEMLLAGDPLSSVYQAGPCVVKHRKSRWTCDGQCQIQNYSGDGGVTWGPIATASGSTETGACQAAKSAAVALTPQGSYPRHCKCFNCTKR